MFQIFGIRTLTALVTRVARVNCTTTNLVPKVLLGMIAALSPAVAQTLCTYASNDTMTAGPNPQGYYFDDRISNGTTYTTNECSGFYTVDVIVPGTYNAPYAGNAITISAGFAQWQSTEATCKHASESVLIYKRTSIVGSSYGPWKLVSSQNVPAGTWVPFVPDGRPFCVLSSPLRVVASGYDFGSDEYRVLVLPELFGAPAQAGVWWEWSL